MLSANEARDKCNIYFSSLLYLRSGHPSVGFWLLTQVLFWWVLVFMFHAIKKRSPFCDFLFCLYFLFHIYQTERQSSAAVHWHALMILSFQIVDFFFLPFFRRLCLLRARIIIAYRVRFAYIHLYTTANGERCRPKKRIKIQKNDGFSSEHTWDGVRTPDLDEKKVFIRQRWEIKNIASSEVLSSRRCTHSDFCCCRCCLCLFHFLIFASKGFNGNGFSNKINWRIRIGCVFLNTF